MIRKTYNAHLSAYKHDDISGVLRVKCSQKELTALKLGLRNNLDCRTEVFVLEDMSAFHPAWFANKAKSFCCGDNLIPTLCGVMLGYGCGVGLGLMTITLFGG